MMDASLNVVLLGILPYMLNKDHRSFLVIGREP